MKVRNLPYPFLRGQPLNFAGMPVYGLPNAVSLIILRD